jgi:membrane-associated protein
MDQVIMDWLREHRESALLIVPFIAFLEAFPGVGLFVSGVILLSVCTFMYVEQIATLAQMLPLAFIGAAISDHLGYYTGRWIGPRFHHTGFAEKRRSTIEKAENMFRRYGEFAIVFGRLMTAIRSIVPLMTGITGITRVRYTLFDLLACAIWTTGLGLLIVGLDQVF